MKMLCDAFVGLVFLFDNSALVEVLMIDALQDQRGFHRPERHARRRKVELQTFIKATVDIELRDRGRLAFLSPLFKENSR